MTRLGLDCQAAPDFATLQRMVSQSGATWLCSYIGGPTALGTGWTADVHRALSPLLADGFLPTYAGVGYGGPFTAARGNADGDDAINLLGFAGFPVAGSPLVLDLEYAAYEAGKGKGIDAYCQAWAAWVRNAGAVPVLYSSVAGCDALGGLFDAVWVANWTDSGTSALSRPPNPAGGPEYWQYASSVAVAGVNCDANVAQDDAVFARPIGDVLVADVDQGWLDKKAAVVEAAGREQTRADQLEAERRRPQGVRKTVLDQLIAGMRADMGVILE